MNKYDQPDLEGRSSNRGVIIMAISQKLLDAMTDYNKAYDEYLMHFGEESLDRVILLDPLHCYDIAPEKYLKTAAALRRIIKRNKPLQQIPVEMWEKLIF